MKQEITEEQIKNWKERHGKIVRLELPVATGSKEVLVAVFKKPSLETFSMSQKIAQNDPLSALKILAKGMFLGGDAAIYEDVTNLISIEPNLNAIIDIRKAEIKEL